MQLLSLDVTEEDSIDRVLIYVDNAIQYGEDLDVKVPRVSHIGRFAVVTNYDVILLLGG